MLPAWLTLPAKAVDEIILQAARTRQSQLTKPPGSLGDLEDIAERLCAMQACHKPTVERVRIVVFAADHGIAAEGVSAFPQAVTVEMVRNFARGGAAIGVLARALGATLEVVNAGTVTDPGKLAGVIDSRVAPGTANFVRAPAMTAVQLAAALETGADAVVRAMQDGAHLFIGGEMGIANTTSASAIACALLNLPAHILVGPGTGLDKKGVAHKVQVVEAALAYHRAQMKTPQDVLRCVGGFEIAALTGAYLRCAQLGVPVLVDGFIAGAAALVAVHLCPDVKLWFFYAHNSAEPGHAQIMQALGAKPLLQLGMRLGEGSGAAVAVPLLRLACALHNEMATFAQAGVSESIA